MTDLHRYIYMGSKLLLTLHAPPPPPPPKKKEKKRKEKRLSQLTIPQANVRNIRLPSGVLNFVLRPIPHLAAWLACKQALYLVSPRGYSARVCERIGTGAEVILLRLAWFAASAASSCGCPNRGLGHRLEIQGNRSHYSRVLSTKTCVVDAASSFKSIFNQRSGYNTKASVYAKPDSLPFLQEAQRCLKTL